MKRMIAILLISINIISLTACTQKAGENEKYQVVAAEYPSMAKYPDESKYNTKLNGDFDSDGFLIRFTMHGGPIAKTDGSTGWL